MVLPVTAFEMALFPLFFSFFEGDFFPSAAPMLLLDFRMRSSSEALASSVLKPHPMSRGFLTDHGFEQVGPRLPLDHSIDALQC